MHEQPRAQRGPGERSQRFAKPRLAADERGRDHEPAGSRVGQLDRRLERGAIRGEGEPDQPPASAREFLRRCKQTSMVAGRDGDGARNCARHAEHTETVGLRRAASEDQPIPRAAGRPGPEQGHDAVAGVLECRPGAAARGMRTRRIREGLRGRLAHRLRHTGVGRCGGGVVEIDRRRGGRIGGHGGWPRGPPHLRSRKAAIRSRPAASFSSEAANDIRTKPSAPKALPATRAT